MADSAASVSTIRLPAPAWLRDTLKTEEREGLKQMTKGRTMALVVIAGLLFFLSPIPEVFYYHALLAVFVLNGLIMYRVLIAYPDLTWLRYAFVTVDMILLSYTVLAPNPFLSELGLPQMQIRNGVFVYNYVIVAAVAFSYSPRLMAWAGVAAALSWSAGVVWLASLPDSLTTFDVAPFDRADPVALKAVLAIFHDPHFVDFNILIQDVVVMGIVTGILVAQVMRARRMVERQAGVARERANLSRYFAPTMVERLAREDAPLAAARQQAVAVMFADVVGFTRLAEDLAPEAMLTLMRDIHLRLERAVFEHHGTLDKFLGDGVMATFGTPETAPDDAVNALRCAEAVFAEIDALNRGRRDGGQAEIRIAVGIHHGPVVLGDVGSARRMEFAVLGDAVNVASRLEEMNRELGTKLIVSDALLAAASAAPGASSIQELRDRLKPEGAKSLRNRAEAVAVHSLS